MSRRPKSGTYVQVVGGPTVGGETFGQVVTVPRSCSLVRRRGRLEIISNEHLHWEGKQSDNKN